jgi:hypothetical protein
MVTGELRSTVDGKQHRGVEWGGTLLPDHGSRITDHGSRITDHGSRITDVGYDFWDELAEAAV